MLVKEAMTRDVITVSIDDSVEECSRLLFEHDISGLPVLDEDGNLVGMVTEGDLIRRAARIKAPGYLEILGGQIFLGNPNKFVKEIQRAMSNRAGDLMTDKIITISPDDTIEEATTRMLENRVSRLPVLDENNKLAGILSRRDIMQTLYKEEA